MDFRKRLQRATERGHDTRDAKARQAAAKALGEEECKRLHTNYRLELCDAIETCLHQLAENFPGFQYHVVADARWGAAVRRDDLSLKRGKRDNHFSRLEMTVSPFNEFHVLDLVAKGAVRNKENFSRHHYQLLKDVDLDTFKGLVEQWTLDYAEQYAAAEDLG